MFRNHRTLLRSTTLVAVLVSGVSLAQAELPLITDARVPATPPGATVAAGFLTLTNSNDEPLILQGADSTSVPEVELHLTEIKDDVATMTEQDEVSIPAGETLVLEHGGYHLMLMGLEAPLEVGNVIDLTLHTSAGEVELSMPVVEAGMPDSGMEGHGEGHGEGDMDHMDMEGMSDGAGEGAMDHDKMDN